MILLTKLNSPRFEMPLRCLFSYQADESVEELSPGAALCIYRIAQEALGNVAKHSKAKQAKVRLTRSENRVCLVVSDDGVGYNRDGSGKAGAGTDQ